MGRHRKHNKHLPRGVTLERGTYFYRGADRRRVNLGRSFADAMAKYGEMLGDHPLTTLAEVLDRYLQTEVPKKAAATQRDNIHQMKGIRAVFGRMAPSRIEPVHIYAFRDKLAAKSGATQGNLHLALLKHVFTKAIEWGAVKVNPARDVRKIPVTPRDRYVEDWEFALVNELAPETLQVAMDLAVLTGMSRGDVLALTRTQCRDDGIHYTRQKTQRRSPRKLIVEWTDELRAVISRAKQIKPQIRQHIVATNQGKPFTPSGFSTAWERLMVRARAAGLEHRFHFHDLRAKSATDSDDLMASSERLGHSSPEITKRVYRRKPIRVKPLR